MNCLTVFVVSYADLNLHPSHDIAQYELVRIEVCLRKQLYRTIKAKNRVISHDIARYLTFIVRYRTICIFYRAISQDL